MTKIKINEINVKHDIKKNRYYASSSGIVYYKNAAGKLVKMKPFTTRDGYSEYVLTKNDGSKQHIQAQIIILSTFKGISANKKRIQVNHINGNRKDNNIKNLAWVTPKENIAHSFKYLSKTVWNSPKRKSSIKIL